ncbi:hypothetical protein [Cellulophaga sp. BC115SP]|uniref:hypothetical protein n=1 Tax=Cellulophaga sp. BC115SP TaxID=2683263 RepID=UPI001411B626|nr:hypothetical protein [Cellulophaga sp. BC115SP]NBB31976.1 hypothetical protein [Cellulophaga sp. BC115SP]
MRESNKISNVRQFSILNNSVLLTSKSIIKLNNKILFESDRVGGNFLSGNWLYMMDRKKTYLCELKQSVKYEVDNSKNIFWHTIDFKNLSVVVGIDNKLIENHTWVFEYCLYNFQTQQLTPLNQVKSYPIPISWKGHLLFDETKFLLSAFSIEKKETIWQFKLFEHFKYDRTWGDGEFYHFVGVWNDVLWIDINESHLIGVDIQTGLLKYDFCKPTKIFGKPTKPYHERLYGKLYSNIDKERNLLFGFNYDTYWEINLNDPTTPLHLYIFEEECTKYNCFLSLQRYCFDRQKLYYVDAFNGTVASIDRDTKEFQFLYQFPEASAGTLMEIQVSEDKVYILDNQSTLHIFEKEQA